MRELPFPDPSLVDEVVRLRAWSQSDVDAAHEATQDPLISRFTRVPEGQSREEVRRFIAGREPARRCGVLALVITDAQTKVLLGAISLMGGVECEQRRGAIGFWLARWARGRGVATHAVALLSRWALGELGLARVELGTYPDNYASQRVAERCGFVREGVLRSFLQVKGSTQDVVMFSLLPDDLGQRCDSKSPEWVIHFNQVDGALGPARAARGRLWATGLAAGHQEAEMPPEDHVRDARGLGSQPDSNG